MIELLTERQQILNLPKILKGSDVYAKEAQKLQELDINTCTAEDVNNRVENNWVKPEECDCCGKKSWNAVRIGECPDWETNSAVVCFECLVQAAFLLSQEINKQTK